MAEDHLFKRIVENDADATRAEEEKQLENEDKVDRFKWDDIEDEEIEGKVFDASDEEINECVLVLSNHLLSTISVEHFAGMDTSGMRFVIPVDLDLHSLLKKRFEEDWNLDSRLDMFQCIRENLSAEFSVELGENENRVKLDEKIQTALPPTYRKKFTSGEILLEDDAMVVDDESNMISIEIPLSFAAIRKGY